MLLIVACSAAEVSIDLKPANYQSAKSLAQTLADTAHCSDLEDTSYRDEISFSCQININRQDAMFKVYIFYSAPEKTKMENELRSGMKDVLYKSGNYFIITKYTSFADKASTAEIATTADDFAYFPGKLSIP